MRTTRMLATTVAALSLLTASCGGNADPDAGTADAAGSETSPEEDAGASGDADEGGSDEGGDDDGVTVAAPSGDVELDEPAERVVALEWTHAEDLLAVGVEPAGIADVEGYRDYVGVEPQPSDEVADVGTRQEPSLEAISALDPDLIVGVSFRHEGIVDQLEAIAPTVLYEPYPEPDEQSQYEEMEATFTALAAAVDRRDEGEQVLDDLDATYERVADDLDELELPTTEVAVAQGFTAEQVPTIRMFTDNALAIEALDRLGLDNAWDGEPEPFGYTNVAVEGLTALGDAYLLTSAPDEDDVFDDELADNPLWQDLETVTSDRVVALDERTWLFGGPLSMEALVTDVGERIGEAAEAR